MDNAEQEIKPIVGMGVTMLCWSDRSAGTIVKVRNNNHEIFVTEDIATRIDENGMSDQQSYKYETNYDAQPIVFTLRKNGKYIRKGSDIKNGLALILGVRDKYYDYSF